MIPTIPKTNIIQAMMMRAYGKTSPFKEATVAVLTFSGTIGSWILKAVYLIWPVMSNVMLSIADFSKMYLKHKNISLCVQCRKRV